MAFRRYTDLDTKKLVIGTPIHFKLEMSEAKIYEYSQNYFQPKIGKNMNIQLGSEKEYSYKEKGCI